MEKLNYFEQLVDYYPKLAARIPVSFEIFSPKRRANIRFETRYFPNGSHFVVSFFLVTNNKWLGSNTVDLLELEPLYRAKQLQD